MASQNSCQESLLPQAAAATTSRHTELERFRVERMWNDELIALNEQNVLTRLTIVTISVVSMR